MKIIYIGLKWFYFHGKNKWYTFTVIDFEPSLDEMEYFYAISRLNQRTSTDALRQSTISIINTATKVDYSVVDAEDKKLGFDCKPGGKSWFRRGGRLVEKTLYYMTGTGLVWPWSTNVSTNKPLFSANRWRKRESPSIGESQQF